MFQKMENNIELHVIFHLGSFNFSIDRDLPKDKLGLVMT
jgi:hypothetical protein